MGFRRILLRAVSRSPPNRHSDASDRCSQLVRFLHGQHRRSAPIDHRLHQNSRWPVTQSVEIGGSRRGLQSALLQGTRTYLLTYLLTCIRTYYTPSCLSFAQNFQDPVRRAIVDQKVEPKGHNGSWMTVQEGVRRVRNELFAFHAERGAFYKIVQETYLEEEKCGIMEIDVLNMLYPLLVMQTRSPYLEIVKNA